MKLKRTLLPAFVMGAGAVMLMMQGCSGGGSMSSGSWHNNFKCTAVSGHSGGHRSTGWSTSRSAAKANALDKCRARSAYPGRCRITHCANESVTG